ncbi:MAG: hypothetical protein ACOYOT_06745 [Bacteroidales bacterium]
MKKIILTTAVFGMVFCSLFAQSEIDALKYSKTDINGTARYMSMGGAFGALGSDISTLANNPAGIGVYRTSEFAVTANISNVATAGVWNKTSVEANNMKFNFNNFGYIGAFKPDLEGLVSFNIGIGFNRLKDYYRNSTFDNSYLNATIIGTSSLHQRGISLTDYIAQVTNRYSYKGGDGIPESVFKDSKAYQSVNDWIGVLAYDAGLIDPISGTNTYKPMNTTVTPSAKLKISERGSADEYNISFGGNVYDVFYFGATIGISDLSYRLVSTYDEDFLNSGGYTLSNSTDVRGSGINLKAGVILRPTDYFRFGLAVHTPTFYKITEYYDANILSNYADGTTLHPYNQQDAHVYVPENSYTEYSLQTPFKLQASSAFVLGKKGILSFEYEMADYSHMKMKDPDGYGWAANDYINQDMGIGNTFKFGGEFRLTKQFSLRGGYATQTPFIKSSLMNNEAIVGEVDVFGSTLPHYTLDKGTDYYSGGFGYRFGSYYTDFAFVHRVQNEDVYAFSPISIGSDWVIPEKATLKTTANQLLVTFGIKF